MLVCPLAGKGNYKDISFLVTSKARNATAKKHTLLSAAPLLQDPTDSAARACREDLRTD